MAVGLSAGGGSSASTWAVHGACERFRGSDPLITKVSRKSLANSLGKADTTAGIPEARWMRAMTFERLCHEPAFAGEVTARVAGWSELPRPTDVVLVNCHVSTPQTLAALHEACDRSGSGTATLLHSIAVPYPGFDDGAVTPVKPDLAVVASGPAGPVLIVGDVKDYERVRSRINDERLLKGFLQVAMGAFSFERWTALPEELMLSDFGFLAVPRSAFLQPAIEVERLHDHLAEVESQWSSRTEALDTGYAVNDLAAHIARLYAEFRPDTCRTCSLFNYCRHELRQSTDPSSLLVEIGVRPNERASLLPVLRGLDPGARANPRSVAQLRATVTGSAQSTGQRRIDPAGLPGTVNVVVAKTDAAALGYYGVGVQRVTLDGANAWRFETYADPQSPETRRRVMNLIGHELERASGENRRARPENPDPVQVVVPDPTTADLLATTADLLAGIELSRLRWVRDHAMGRPLLTYNGEPATMPKPLEGARRSAVSFLLEQDRARMLQVRTPIVNLTSLVSRHFVPGGPGFEAARLDFAVVWAEADAADHRSLSDRIDAELHTPGARLTNVASDMLHAASRNARDGIDGADARYEQLVTEELRYKASFVDRALAVLSTVPDSKMRVAYRSLEGDAQLVWRRRKDLRASDLVRFGRTYNWWRNQLVNLIDQDSTCAAQVWALTNPLRAAEQATDAGDRTVAWATVISVGPILLRLDSRRFAVGDRVALLAVGNEPWLEQDVASVVPQKSAIRINGVSAGPLEERRPDLIAPDPTSDDHTFEWHPGLDPGVAAGDRLVLARLDWFASLQSNTSFNVKRPIQDAGGAPKLTCTPSSYAQNAEEHRWCCRPHEVAEAEFADDIALRRSRRQLNPEVWPPVRDADGFEVPATGKPTADDVQAFSAPVPDGVTADDVE